MAYGVLGFAVLHAITRGMAAAPSCSAAFMLAVLVFGWPVLALCAARPDRHGFDLRARVARKRGPPPALDDEIRNLTNQPSSDQGVTTMEVILLERIGKLGQMGDVVRVKDGFARNFLLPRGKALARHRRQQNEVRRHEGRVAGAQPRTRRATPTSSPPSSTARPSWCSGRRAKPASSTARSRPAISPACSRPRAPKSTARRSRSTRRSRPSASTRCRWRCIRKSRSIVTVIVARSADEAERIARGEDVTVRRDRGEEEAAAAVAAAEAFFEPEAAKALREGEEAEAEAEAAPRPRPRKSRRKPPRRRKRTTRRKRKPRARNRNAVRRIRPSARRSMSALGVLAGYR